MPSSDLEAENPGEIVVDESPGNGDARVAVIVPALAHRSDCVPALSVRCYFVPTYIVVVPATLKAVIIALSL